MVLSSTWSVVLRGSRLRFALWRLCDTEIFSLGSCGDLLVSKGKGFQGMTKSTQVPIPNNPWVWSTVIVTNSRTGIQLDDLYMGVNPKIGGFPPKWMVKIMVPNPMNKWMIWGFTPIFGNTHIDQKKPFSSNPLSGWFGLIWITHEASSIYRVVKAKGGPRGGGSLIFPKVPPSSLGILIKEKFHFLGWQSLRIPSPLPISRRIDGLSHLIPRS